MKKLIITICLALVSSLSYADDICLVYDEHDHNPPPPPPSGTQVIDFEIDGPVETAFWGLEGSSEYSNIVQLGGKFRIELPSGNDLPPSQTTYTPSLWWDSHRGRLDYQSISGDFTYIVRDVVRTIYAPHSYADLTFCGLMVMNASGDYEFGALGDRGAGSTIEVKSTIQNDSSVSDIGPSTMPYSIASDGSGVMGPVDLQVSRTGSSLNYSYSLDGVNWTTMNTPTPISLDQTLRVGLIGYNFAYPREGVCEFEQVEIVN